MNPLPNCAPITNASKHNITIYSGHDYTLLTVFGLLRAMNSMSSSVGFGSYVIFELWDKVVQDETGGPATKFARLEEDTRVLRIKYNANPFYNKSLNKVSPGEVQTENEVILKEYTMTELNELLQYIKSEVDSGNAGLTKLDSGVRSLKECHSFDKILSPVPLTPGPCSPNETYHDMRDLDLYIADASLSAVVNPNSEDNG